MMNSGQAQSTDWGIDGLLREPKMSADGVTPYRGRLQLVDVQWLRTGGSVSAAGVTNVRSLMDMSRSQLINVDHSIQRGVKPGSTADSVVPLSAGYPPTADYVFDHDRADDMVNKLHAGKRLHLNPLVWSLRPGEFEAYFSEDNKELWLYRGTFFVPDSHHRHQAIQKAGLLKEETPDEYPLFSLEMQFNVELYFFSRMEEGEYFYEKNNLGKSADRTRGYELTTEDPLSDVAKRVAAQCAPLIGNVNRVTDRLSSKVPHVATLSTLRGMVKTFVANDSVPPDEIDSVASDFSVLFELIAAVRPELGQLSESDRVRTRRELMVDQAVMLHGYAALMAAIVKFDADAVDGQRDAWLARLSVLSGPDPKTDVDDVMSRSNPRWRELGVLQSTKTGGTTISNTRQTRASVGQFLIDLVLPSEDSDEGGAV